MKKMIMAIAVCAIVAFGGEHIQSGVQTQDERDLRRAVPWEEYWKLENRVLPGTDPMECITLAGKRQLFIDNVVIEYLSDLKRKIHEPTKYEGNPVLRADKPWETEIYFCNVVWDVEEHIFKAWYQCQVGGREALSYAVARDGIHWEKPSLGIIEFAGSKENNLVLPPGRIGSPTVIKDVMETDPSRRYKYFAMHDKPVFGMYVGFSPDGIHWTIRDQPVLSAKDDPALNDRPNMMQDVDKRRFIAFTKREINTPFGRGDVGMIYRCRAVSISKDFESWTKPVPAIYPDDKDPEGLQIYGLVGFTYEGRYLGLMDMYWSSIFGQKDLTVTIQLAVSLDGEGWWRAGNRDTFLPLGAEGSWDRFRVHPANTPPILRGDEIWIYYRGAGNRRHAPSTIPPQRRREPWLAPGHRDDPPLAPGVPGTGMGLARLRRDGFVSIDAGPRPGMLLTKPLLFDGDDLHVNVNAGQGRLRAELLHVESVQHNYPAFNWAIQDPVPGFGLDDCVPLKEDTTDGVIRWKGGNIGQFGSKRVVIRFELVQGSLYSFWVK
jgi:predicted GH43/DUF377 family glycosyl hydrolase